MSGISKETRMPEELRELYRLVLKEGVKVESFYDGSTLNIWSRGAKNSTQQYWAEFGESGLNFIEKPLRGIGFTMRETIGIGIINPRVIRKRKISSREQDINEQL